jgi:hypothetical protein
MRPMPVVMARIDAKHVFELAAAEDEQPVEALATHAADPALGVCVRVRCPDGGADHGDPFALEDVIEAAAELGVAIMDQEAERLARDRRSPSVGCAPVERPRRLSGSLCRRRTRSGGAPGR